MDTRVRGLSDPCPYRRFFKKIHVRVRVRVRGLKNFQVCVRGLKNFHVRVRVRDHDFSDVRVRVRVRGLGRTLLSADTGLRVHRSLVSIEPITLCFELGLSLRFLSLTFDGSIF